MIKGCPPFAASKVDSKTFLFGERGPERCNTALRPKEQATRLSPLVIKDLDGAMLQDQRHRLRHGWPHASAGVRSWHVPLVAALGQPYPPIHLGRGTVLL